MIWQPSEIEADQQDGLIEITLIKFLLFKNLAVKGARAKPPAAQSATMRH